MSRYLGYNNLLIFGTAGVSEDGELFLSEHAQVRAHRAAAEYLRKSFNKKTGRIVIVGGYSKELQSNPPKERESRLIGRFLLEQYQSIPEGALLYEDESTDTWENYLYSLRDFPEIFEGKLGLISHPNHLKRAIKIGKEVLHRPNDDTWYEPLPTSQQDNPLNEIAAMKIAQQRILEMRMTGDS